MTRSTNMEHVAHLQRMANESWIGSPERAALDAAIASLSAPQPPAEAQDGGEVNVTITVRDGEWVGTYAEWCRRKQIAPPSAPDGAVHDALQRDIDARGVAEIRQAELDALTRSAPSAPVGVEVDAAGEDILTRALNSAYEHGARQAVFPLSDCARQVREALAQQPAAGAGQWVRCTPELLSSGVSCAKTPRRPGDGHSHDHFIAHTPQQPAAVDGAMLRNLRDYFEGINNDEDGDDYRNLSADAMDLIDSTLAAQQRGRSDD